MSLSKGQERPISLAPSVRPCTCAENRATAPEPAEIKQAAQGAADEATALTLTIPLLLLKGY
ncbi:MAG: hypothetical protein AAF414_11580 [Pseudomonadota bacterium]